MGLGRDTGIADLALLASARLTCCCEIAWFAIGGVPHNGVARIGILFSPRGGRCLTHRCRDGRGINTDREMEGAYGADSLAGLGGGRLSDGHHIVASGSEHPVRMGVGWPGWCSW